MELGKIMVSSLIGEEILPPQGGKTQETWKIIVWQLKTWSVKCWIGCEPGVPGQWGNRGGSVWDKVYKLCYVTSRYTPACRMSVIAIVNKYISFTREPTWKKLLWGISHSLDNSARTLAGVIPCVSSTTIKECLLSKTPKWIFFWPTFTVTGQIVLCISVK